jgi:hypothetical protein
MASQAQQMLEYMLEGHTLTGLQAMQMFGTTAPATRFSEIRNMIRYLRPPKIGTWYSLNSEPRSKGRKRWLEYSIRIVK